MERAAEERECLLRIARGLASSRVGHIIGGDVLVWIEPGDTKLRVAFRNRAQSLERIYSHSFDNNDHALDVDLQRHLGFEARAGAGVAGELGQKLSEGEVSWPDELDDAIGDLAVRAYEKCMGLELSENSAAVSLMPSEGAPLTPFASAKKGWQKKGGAEPPTRLEKVDGQLVRTVDLCKIAPRIESYAVDLIARASKDAGKPLLDGRETSDFMVMHATEPTAVGAAAVAACGGWLYASLGIGMVPSVAFGPLVLFASPNLVLAGLKPRRPRGAAQAVKVYNVDVWTSVSNQYPKIARTLLGQLTGHPEYAVTEDRNHQWILGDADPRTQVDFREIETLPELARTLRDRSRAWPFTMSVDDAEQRWTDAVERQSEHMYPFLEGKTIGTLTPACWKLAIVAKSWKARASQYLKKTGVTCDLVVVDDPPGVTDTEHWHLSAGPAGATWLWSKVVARAAVDYTQKRTLFQTY